MSDRHAALGFPLLLSASNKTFLGKLLDLEVPDRRDASLAATALGISRGCRVLRVHDVAGTRLVRDTLERVLASRAETGHHQRDQRDQRDQREEGEDSG